MILILATVATIRQASANTSEDEGGIDEHDAVIEFDLTDDLFVLLTARESTTVHLYTRKDGQYLAKRKAFRKAAKRDIDAATALNSDAN